MKKNLLSPDQMVGGTWKYQGIAYRFQNYKTEGEQTILVTDRKWFEFETPFELECFLADCRPDDSNLPERKSTTDLALPDSTSDEVMAKLKGILMDNIEKVNQDKSFVIQAQTVSKNVQTLINLSKLELEIKRSQAER